jgi:hypothetical protein
MKQALRILLSLVAVIGMVAAGCAQTTTVAPASPTKASVKPTEPSPGPMRTPFVSEELREEASRALETFKKLVTEQNYKQMGFESLNEVALATLGEPIQDFMVRLDHLSKYQEGRDPNEILSPTNLFVFPVLVEEQVRSSIDIVGQEGTWEAVSFGAPNFIGVLTNQLMAQSKAQGLPTHHFFVVRVAAFNLVFLGNRADKELVLTPLVDTPEFKLEAGVPVPADKAFAALAPAAEKHDGLPR